jgi:preprotein translocase subunit SecA
MGKDNLAQYLIEQGEKTIGEVDLSAGREFLEDDWGRRSLCDWARLKFGVKLEPAPLAGKGEAEVVNLLHEQVMAVYRQKEIEFPVRVGMARFMADKAQVGGGQRYDREGLYNWATQRFAATNAAPKADLPTLSEEDFRTQSRSRLQETVLALSRAFYPPVSHEQIDERLEESFSGARLSESEDAKELAEWMKEHVGVEVSETALTDVPQETARQILWNAFDDRYRPEMRGMERSLLLNQLDTSWKNHLYTMDHLRSSIGLRGMGQMDPKIEYKKEGMKEFESMWEGVQDKVTDHVFRMEEAEGFQESLWTIGATIKEAAPRVSSIPANDQQQAITSSGKGDKKPEPIRNRGERVGRNEPCPCGSGKKYKNCHMRQAAV